MRSIRAAWERGDYSSTDWAQPEIEWEIVDGPAPGRWTGLAGGQDFFRDLASVWEGFRSEAERYLELDDERVLVLLRFGGRGKTSGVELAQMQAKGADVFHVQASKVTKIIVYFDRERAFADLGLASEADPSRR